MKLILILAALTLLFLPALAVEPVNVGGAFGAHWLSNSANANPGLWTWGSPPYSSYYTSGGIPYLGTYPYLGNYPYAGIYPYSKFIQYSPYGEWQPYTLYYPNDFYSSGYPYNRNLAPSSFSVNPPLL
ncbi:MAG: hypothetical protein LUQ38_11635 [Methanotrichaceae archaeon]|nr:hypothetical protein [Methanotrichaceae archaeon]MDD1757945.1 hypothetical protein [Methanotrichaceae archaeon]